MTLPATVHATNESVLFNNFTRHNDVESLKYREIGSLKELKNDFEIFKNIFILEADEKNYSTRTRMRFL